MNVKSVSDTSTVSTPGATTGGTFNNDSNCEADSVRPPKRRRRRTLELFFFRDLQKLFSHIC